MTSLKLSPSHFPQERKDPTIGMNMTSLFLEKNNPQFSTFNRSIFTLVSKTSKSRFEGTHMTELMKPAGWRSASFGLNWSA